MDKILIITPYTPDNQGIGVSYTSQLIKELSKDFLIDLVYFRYEDDAPFEPYNSNIRIIWERVISIKDKLKALCFNPTVFPLFSARYDKKTCKFLKKIATADNYKFIYLDFSQTFFYAQYIKHPDIILMSHDVIAQKYSRMKKYLRPWAMHTERDLLKKGTVTFTFSQKDCYLLSQYYGINGKHTTFFLHPNVQNAYPTSDYDYFVFFGSWSRVENLEGLEWFINNVLELIPGIINFKVIGGGLPYDIKGRIRNIPNMEYLGFLDNPYPIIANAKAEIAPLFKGAGVKVKCIEALGCGTPVIGTDIAFEGIEEEFRDYFTHVTTAQEFAKAITEFQISNADKHCLKHNFLHSYNQKNILEYLRSSNHK